MGAWLSIWEGLLRADGRVTAFALVAVAGVTALELTARSANGLERLAFLLVHLVCVDFLHNSHHRAQHRLAFLWPIHELHHSRLPEHRDRNFAPLFPFLDRVFGTYCEPRRDEYPPTGTMSLASDASIATAMARPFRIGRGGLPVAVVVMLWTFVTPARAELATIDVLLDLDEDIATGCVVGTIEGDAEGVDLRIRTVFDVGTDVVTSATTAACADAVSGTFEPEVAIATVPQVPWSGVVGNGVAGSTLVETHGPLDVIGLDVIGPSRRARAFVVLSSLVGEDALLTGESAEPLRITLWAPSVPTLLPWALGCALAACVGLARAGIVGRGLVVGVLLSFVGASWLLPARGLALLGDGELRAWTLDERIAGDPRADAPEGVDLLDFYAAVEPSTGELWLRVDVLFGAPVCLPGWGRVDPGSGFVCTMQPPLDQGPFGGAVALTFDDGPEPMVTPLILATLRAQGIPATFFVQGRRLESEQARALALEIHEDPLFRLGNHSQTHARFTLLEPEEVEIELTTASERIREAIADPCYAPRYFRFPFGSADCDSMGSCAPRGSPSRRFISMRATGATARTAESVRRA